MYQITPSLLISADSHLPDHDNQEEYAQKHGHLLRLPTLAERISYHTGELLIKIGEKLTANNPASLQLNGKAA